MPKTQSTLETVDFNGNSLIVITAVDGQRLVAMRPVCEAIGLDSDAQLQRIKRDKVLSSTTVVMNVVAADGKEREQVCLPLDYLNGWLFGISTSRVKPEIRQRLEDYKRECYKVLNEYWNGKQVGGELVQQQSEMVVAQAYANAAYAADIVSRHVFNAVINGDADPFHGRWLLETHYAGPNRQVVPSIKEVPRDALMLPVKEFLDVFDDRLEVHFDADSLVRLISICSSSLRHRAHSRLQSNELQRRIAERNKSNPATATAVAGSKR